MSLPCFALKEKGSHCPLDRQVGGLHCLCEVQWQILIHRSCLATHNVLLDLTFKYVRTGEFGGK